MLVKTVVQCLTNAQVVEGLLGVVEIDLTLHDRRCCIHDDIRRFFQTLNMLGRHDVDKLGFTGAQHGNARGIFKYWTETDGIELGQPLLPIVGVLLHDQVLGGIVFLEYVGTCAAGVKGHFFFGKCERLRTNHDTRRVSELVDEGRERFLQVKFNGCIINHFHRLNIAVELIAGEVVFRIGDTVKVRLNRSRIEGFSVRELNALLEFDRVFETVFAHVVAFGENIHKLHVFVKSKEAFIEGLGYVLRQRITRIIRIERGEGRVDGNCQIFGDNGLSGQSSCTDERKRDGSILFSIHRSSSLAFI